jgi:bifunctional oligoribonuclease and PAP phosphatase NrnA
MEKFDLLKSKLAKASSILITTHAWPDADGIGGQIALCMTLKQLGKKAICVNELPLLQRYKYLDPEDVVFGMDEADDMDKVDLVIIVDTNTIKRVGKRMENYASDKELLYIDHHPCAEINPSEHIVDTTKAATGELVGDIILDLGVKFNKTMALALYTAIIIDTSSLRYPNVTADTHKMVSELMKAGVRPPEAYNGIYGTKKVKHMHILGQVLQTANCNTREDVAWIVLDMEKITAQGTDVEDTHAFVNNLLILDNIKVACMFRDDGEDVKISFRSTGNLDVGIVARMLGGGGHDHSAATILHKSGRSLEQVIKESVQKIEVAVDSIQK